MRGLPAAICSVMSLTNSRKLSFFATKSVSQLTSTSTPTLPPRWIYEATMPSWPRVTPSCGRGRALLAQNLDGLFEVAARLGERLLAFHYADLGLLAQRLTSSGEISAFHMVNPSF